MTAPTQPPDPRVQRIAKAFRHWWTDHDIEQNIDDFARVLVEELGGRERETVPCEQTHRSPYECIYFTAWSRVCDALRKIDEDWALHGAAIDKAPEMIRTLAQRATDAEQRATEFEYVNKMLDDARKSAEQSARNLRENNATLRAELDAIKGAQVPYRWTVVSEDRLSFTFTSVESAQTWAKNEGGEVIPLFTHPAPALPVVGACVVSKDGDAMVAYYSDSWGDLGRKEENAQEHAKRKGGTAHQLLLGAPLSTEGGK